MRIRFNFRTLSILLLAAALLPRASAQPRDKNDFPGEIDPIQQNEMEADSSFKSWKYFAEVNVPKGDAPYCQLELTQDIIARSAPTLNDLRLANVKGERIPYVLQTLTTERRQTPVRTQRRFNAGTDAKTGAYHESFELDPIGAPGYNEIEIRTDGMNFRRRVRVEGSNDEKFADALSILPTNSFVFRFDIDGRYVDSPRILFDYKQFRFLKVLVFPDANNKNDTPTIQDVSVRQTIFKQGEEVTRTLDKNSERQAVAAAGGPGSAWFIDLGQPDFVNKLTFRSNKIVERPIQLQVAEPGEPRFDIYGVDSSWQKDPNGNIKLVLRFNEVRARRFRLVVTDFANEPLELWAESYGAAKRRLIFAAPDNDVKPLKLYFGNPYAGPARYDLEKTLPTKLEPTPTLATLENVQDNPSYIKPPPPFHERHRWAIYAVLTTASLVLIGLLVSLARQIKPASATV